MAEEFVVTEEHEQLRQAVRAFCARHADEATVRALMESPDGYDVKAWELLGSELGVLGLTRSGSAVTDSDEETGGGLVAQTIVAEELGAALLCGPVIGTMALAIPLLDALPATPRVTGLLDSLTAGTARAAVAFTEVDGGLGVGPVDVATTEADDGHHTLTGRTTVIDGPLADTVLILATGASGPALYVVPAVGDHATQQPLRTMDLTRRRSVLELDRAPAELLAGPGETEPAVRHALRIAAVLLAAEQLGGTQHIVDQPVAYAKARYQFGRSIGSFEAIKHRLADLYIALGHARATAYHAAWAVQDGTDDPDLAVSLAQAVCSDLYVEATAKAIQIHGGIGFTWEHSAHLYYKRAVADRVLFGSSDAHRDRIARLVIDGAVAGTSIKVADGS